MIKWPVKLCVRFFTFFTFFQNPKNMTFYVFLSCCTRFPEQCPQLGLLVNIELSIADTFNAHSNFGVDTNYSSLRTNEIGKKQAVGGRPPQYAPALVTLTLKVVSVLSESRVTWATCVPILIFLGLSVLELFPMYATDRRQTSDRSIA